MIFIGDVVIKRNQQIAVHTFLLELILPKIEIFTQPGQFVNLKIDQGNEFILRRPISIAEINYQSSTISLIYKVVGKGTKRLSTYQAGQQINIIAPLGNGYNMKLSKQYGDICLLVGGGIGVPPMYELSKQLRQHGITPIHILGFNNQHEIFFEQEFKQLGETYIATADGSYGFSGLVTQLIQNLNPKFNTYFSCGPTAMLKALTQQLQDYPGFISLENRMACGLGACFACVCKTMPINDQQTPGYSRICYEGPVYPAGVIEL